jgi:hypothetical protein
VSDIRALAKELLASATAKYRDCGLTVETINGTAGADAVVAFRAKGYDPDGWMPEHNRWRAIAFAPDGSAKKVASMSSAKHSLRYAKSQPKSPTLFERDRWPDIISGAGFDVKLWQILGATVTEVVHGDRDVPELRA